MDNLSKREKVIARTETAANAARAAEEVVIKAREAVTRAEAAAKEAAKEAAREKVRAKAAETAWDKVEEIWVKAVTESIQLSTECN